MLELELSARILIQVVIQSLSIEVFISLWNRIFVAFNLFDFLEMITASFTRVLRAVPSRCFLYDCRNCLILDHSIDIDGVVHASKNAILIAVWHIDKFEQLEPQSLQLVCIVLE